MNGLSANHPAERTPPPPLSGSPALRHILGLIALAIALAVYYLTTCPVIYYGDAGELIVAAWRGGIAHPPGYPLYIILLAVFLRLPLAWLAPHGEFLQSIAWQANFLSAVLSAVTVWVVYLILLRLTRRAWWAFAGALLAATGRTFWSQAGIAEVYALNALLAALLTLLALVQSEAQPGSRQRLLLLRWGSLVWGLSLANHHEMFFFAPVWLTMLALALQRPVQRIPRGRIILEGLLFCVLGLLPYLYLPIASSFHPPLNWGDPSNWHNFWSVLTRAEYRAVKAQISGELVTSLEILREFLGWSIVQYLPIIPLLAIPGLSIFFRRSPHRPVLISAAVSLLAMTAVFIVYFAGIDRGSLFFLEVYFIPWFLALSGLATIGCGVLFSAGQLYPARLRPVMHLGATLVLIVAALLSGLLNRRVCDMSDNLAGYIYSHDVLATLSTPDEKAMLITGGDEIFLFWYWNWVEGTEKEVASIGMDALGASGSWFWDDLARAHPDLVIPDLQWLGARYAGDELRRQTLESLIRENRDTYRCWMTAWDKMFDPLSREGPWHMVLDGPVLELEFDTETNRTDYPRASTPESAYLFRELLDVDRAGLAPFEEEVYDRFAAACYNLAMYFWRADDPVLAAEFASLCLRFRHDYSPGENAPTPTELLAFNLVKAGDLALAREKLDLLIEQDPNNSLYHTYMAEVCLAEGDLEGARRELELALTLEPDNPIIIDFYRRITEVQAADNRD